jgi:hypothetical protein
VSGPPGENRRHLRRNLKDHRRLQVPFRFFVATAALFEQSLPSA